MALRFKEGIRHTAADNQRSGIFQKAVQYGNF